MPIKFIGYITLGGKLDICGCRITGGGICVVRGTACIGIPSGAPIVGWYTLLIGDWEALNEGDNGEETVAILAGCSGGRPGERVWTAAVPDMGLESKKLRESLSEAKLDWVGEVKAAKSAKPSCL